MVEITLGADPEVFFELDGKPSSAIGLIGGSKSHPRAAGGGFFILEDNVAAEYNVPPASNPDDFANNIVKGLSICEQYAKANHRGISLKASASFDPKELDRPEALEFGCEPDFDAWARCINDKPSAADSTFRTAGGHVHVGGVTDINPTNLIRCMDLFLGVPSVVLDPDKERRKLYGKAGAFRLKEYGVEYRTLSNFWIFSSEMRFWVWNATLKAIEFAKNVQIEEDSTIGKLIQHTINESDEEGYAQLAKEYPDIRP